MLYIRRLSSSSEQVRMRRDPFARLADDNSDGLGCVSKALEGSEGGTRVSLPDCLFAVVDRRSHRHLLEDEE